ncbi:MAG: N-formylglutamate amidohydrolase [Burkholderiales bacterium]|jgi:predicted N-formylglutamate amidohydrolase|nr:N-formylglutamate amidohydrolase [Burkholderiales bacterium]
MSLPRADYLIVSCEHGGNRVPSRFRTLFSGKLLDSHRGWDPGALALARDIARATGAPLFYSTTSRLLVELNRPLGHPQIFHRDFPQETRQRLLARYYRPYWRAVEEAIRKAGKRVLHLSVHSFTPRLRGVRRRTDIGLLFDPRRRSEIAFCRGWRAAIHELDARLRVRDNDPYSGTFPSLVEAMRRKFGERHYVGIQIEVNQRFPRGDERRWRALRRVLAETFPQ